MIVQTFQPQQAPALVAMWRASFEHGVGVKDPHSPGEQLEYLLQHVVPTSSVRVVMHGERIDGFLASTPEWVVQLYVRVECIGQGIGGALLHLAQAESSGRLELFTFARNARARAFYEHHGFKVTAFGFEPTWQLEDVKYEWVRDGASAGALKR